MPSKRAVSPYLADSQRLGDVISAIQATGTYRFYMLTFEGWSERIFGDKSRADHWRTVFEEHPEFFRLDGTRERASLVWRRQYPKRFHVDEERKLTAAEYEALTDEQKERVSRNPLTPEDIRALISIAIDLHSRALEQQKERHWWIPLASALGALLGAAIGALLRPAT